MRLRPGPTLLKLAGGMVAAAVLCFFFGDAVALIPMLLAAAVALAASDFQQLRREASLLTVERAMPSHVPRGKAFRVCLRIGNSGAAPADCELRDLIPPEAQPPFWSERVKLPPGETRTLSYETRIAVRGLHQFGPVWLRLRGRWRALERQWPLECAGEVKVLPESADPGQRLREDALAEKRMLDRMTQSRLRGEGLEFESLSEYREGDDPRLLDWRASARHSHLIVRRYQVEHHRDVVILVDCGRLMGTDTGAGSKLDRAVDSALVLSRVALARGDRCGVGMFDDRVLGYLPPISGPHAHRTVTETLYNVQSRWRESNFSEMFATLQTRQPKRSLVVVLSDLVDADTSERFRIALASAVRRHVVIFAALRTPFLWDIVKEPTEAAVDVARKAVVLRLLHERQKALHSVNRAGIQVLDVEPKELTVPLLNKYLEIRQANLL